MIRLVNLFYNVYFQIFDKYIIDEWYPCEYIDLVLQDKYKIAKNISQGSIVQKLYRENI